MRCADLVLRWWLRVALTLLAVLALVLPAAARCDPPREQSPVPAGPDPWIADHVDDLVKLYTHLHTHPELSCQEVETAKRIATSCTKAGADVTTNVGKLGVVGVLKNGRARSSWSAPTWTPCPSSRRQVCPTPARSRRATRPAATSA